MIPYMYVRIYIYIYISGLSSRITKTGFDANCRLLYLLLNLSRNLCCNLLNVTHSGGYQWTNWPAGTQRREYEKVTL